MYTKKSFGVVGTDANKVLHAKYKETFDKLAEELRSKKNNKSHEKKISSCCFCFYQHLALPKTIRTSWTV